MKSNKIEIEYGDVFHSNKSAIVIPRSTTGTISNHFENGLKEIHHNHNLESLPYRSLGSLDIVQFNNASNKIEPALHILYATCVDNNTSTYDAIEEIARGIARFSSNNPNIRNIATPLIGTGEGRLNHYQVYKILFETFDKLANNSCRLYIFIKDEAIYYNLLNEIEKNETNKLSDTNNWRYNFYSR